MCNFVRSGFSLCGRDVLWQSDVIPSAHYLLHITRKCLNRGPELFDQQFLWKYLRDITNMASCAEICLLLSNKNRKIKLFYAAIVSSLYLTFPSWIIKVSIPVDSISVPIHIKRNKKIDIKTSTKADSATE